MTESDSRSTAPDDKMDEPIDGLLFWCCRLVHRINDTTKLSDIEQDVLEQVGYWRTEDELRQAYLVALRLRAQEVCDHCEAIGLTGMTPSMVKDNPFLIAAAYGEFCSLNDE
jgi:hypothetical protein